jgi:hypothetical protein
MPYGTINLRKGVPEGSFLKIVQSIKISNKYYLLFNRRNSRNMVI